MHVGKGLPEVTSIGVCASTWSGTLLKEAAAKVKSLLWTANGLYT